MRFSLIAVRSAQTYIWNLSPTATKERKFRVACKLPRAFEGEVRILDPESATWSLVDIEGGISATTALYQNDQFRLIPHNCDADANQPCCGQSWLTPSSKADMEDQCKSAMKRNHHDEKHAYYPCWERQTVRVACPTNKPTGKEWRLQCNVVTLGLV